ncbi:MAG: hypothetical protein ABIR96_00825 [Bdellovibrionota bacterium]
MDMRIRNKWAMCLVVASGLAARPCSASVSVISLGYNTHVGPSNNSMAGASSYSGFLTTESSAAPVRLAVGFGFSYASAFLTYSGSQYAVQKIGAETRLGISTQLFGTAALQPLLGVFGVLGADMFRSGSPPSGASPSELGLGSGWEFEGGMSFKFGASNRLRLLGVYRSFTTRYASKLINVDLLSGRLALAF